jgi:hypothetical protein
LVEAGGNPSGWEQAPEAQGLGFLAGAGNPVWDLSEGSLERNSPRSVNELAAAVDWTQGWSQPARAPAGSASITPVKMVQLLSSFQRNAPVIANGRLETQRFAFPVAFQTYRWNVKIASMVANRNRKFWSPKPVCALFWSSVWVILVVTNFACSAWNDEPPVPSYMPEWSEARTALESALSTWRDAKLPLPDSLSSPSVQFVDRHRRPKERLLAYEIVGQTDIENARQFTVRLKLEGEESPRLVRYNAFGRQPVWVYRLEDYELISHWECKMDEPEAPPKQPLPKAESK